MEKRRSKGKQSRKPKYEPHSNIHAKTCTWGHMATMPQDEVFLVAKVNTPKQVVESKKFVAT